MANFKDIKGLTLKWEGGLSRATTDSASKNSSPYVHEGVTGWHTNRGITYTKLHKYESAFKDFDECIRLKPNYDDAYYNRGVIYLNHGYIEPGCQDARKACDLGNCRLLETAKGKGYCH